MAVDPHADEVKAEIDSDTYAQWVEIRAAIKEAEALEKELRAKIEAQMGEATAATIGGKTVITYRLTTGWNTKGILRDYPELAQHFMAMRVENSFDPYQFAAHHPEIATKYQTRSFREASD